LIECSRTQFNWETIAMAFSTTGTKSLSSEINVTPLIDVLLVLLIIFMVIVPLAPTGLSTTIPTPGSLTESAESPVLVQLNGDTANPVYLINGVAVQSDAIASHLRDLMSTRASRQMLVQANPKFDFGTVSNVVDAGRAAGAESIGLMTQPRPHNP
jgi:biopolymer transport protein TolR